MDSHAPLLLQMLLGEMLVGSLEPWAVHLVYVVQYFDVISKENAQRWLDLVYQNDKISASNFIFAAMILSSHQQN